MEDKKPNILFISCWYPYKSKPLNGIFVKRHAAANTIDCNVSVIFICPGESNSIEESVEDDIYTLRGYYKNGGFKVFKLVRYVLMWRKVLSFYKRKKGKPGLINSNIVYYPVSIIAPWLKLVWGIPYIITEHWSGYMPEDGHYKGFLLKLISRMAVANAEAVVTPSVALSRTMQSWGLKNKYFTISNVVDTETFNIKTTIKQEGDFNFLHISSLNDKQKNITGIIRTFKKFHALHPISKLTILWDEEEKELMDKIRMKESFSEEDGFFLQGRKTGAELATVFHQANAFVLFSNFETQSVVLLEALCCGIPVISSRCGGPEEFITAKNGLLVDAGDETQLLEAMENIFVNAGNYNPVEIRDTVVEMVSPAVISKQFTDIYKMVIKNKG